MKNKNLRELIAQKAGSLKSKSDIIILNDDELSMAMGGTVSCPNPHQLWQLQQL